MPLYTDETFNPDVIPSSFKEDVKQIIVIAVAIGWKCHKSAANSITIISPNDEKKFHFTPRRTSVNLKKVRRDLLKYGDPDKVLLAEMAHGLHQVDPELAKVVTDQVVSGMAPVTDDTSAGVREREPQRSVTEPAKPAPHIVSEQPMMAKVSDGRAYDSPTTVERKWSDGSRDYACTWPGCEFTHPSNRGSVAAHYGKAHRSGEGVRRRPATYEAEVPEARVYAPRRSRIEALAQHIASLVQDGCDPETLAEAALTWVHEQTRHSTPMAAEFEEMTAEETLVRIKMLLDDGSTYASRQQIDALADQVAEATAKFEESERLRDEMHKRLEHAAEMLELQRQATDEANARADRAHSNFQTLKELLNDIDPDTGEQAS
jgi:hypothetical protein